MLIASLDAVIEMQIVSIKLTVDNFNKKNGIYPDLS